MKHVLLLSCALGALSLSAGSALAATAAASGAGTTIGELVVTAERRTENLQDVPIAVSAFSAEALKNERLDGGQNLILQIPNSNYSRSNFGGYNFKIRGIGADVVSFSGTSGVSINENELPVAANHFQDTDFFDVDRVEVLRGPQGTLYGRNATGGAVDLITTQPSKTFGGYASLEYGNYNTIKGTGAINIPIGDAIAIRIAGFGLHSDGEGTNLYLDKRVDGRDLHAVRGTISFTPSERFSAYLMWEHFGENDNRNRIGKQLCIKDPGPSSVGGVPIAPAGGPVGSNYAAFLNQGCIPGSLYQDAAYGTLNSNGTLAGVLTNLIGLGNGTDVFGTHPLQNHNLHDIESARQPFYKAQEDLVDFHMAYNLTDSLTLTSITGFNREIDSNAADYNRLVPTVPFQPVATGLIGPYSFLLFPNGVVHDPQLGTTNLLNTFDFGNGETKEYTQELRLTSSFKGRFNFSVGVFYSEDTSVAALNNYYVDSTSLTAFAQANDVLGGALLGGPVHIDPGGTPDGSGHNYYDARSGGFLKTYAAFGEVYYDLTPALKLTLGGRYNVDQLRNIAYPISLLSPAPNNGPVYPDGAGGFPNAICNTSTAACLLEQNVAYREFTGRANIDWTPVLSFTDKTHIYASYSRGYKGGGFNTPCQASLGASGSSTAACGYPLAYAPEFIDAYEIGTKNTALGGSLIANLTGFYYNYSGYQISRIVSESSVNENINAKIYGLEFESVYSPIRNLTLDANVGYLHSAIGSGSTSIDSLNLTQGNPNYTLVKDTGGANCLAPTAAVAAYIAAGFPAYGLSTQCFAPGAPGVTSLRDGVPVDLSGHKLPNTPDFTVSLGAQYVFDLTNDWKATLRGDYYWQDNSFARIYNAVNDRLASYHVVNATLTFSDEPLGLDVQLFVKNAFNAQPITGTYVTDPTSGLFQNVFTLDLRTYGVQVTKKF
jgi:outer membrane receptor protein involved in Fe transport